MPAVPRCGFLSNPWDDVLATSNAARLAGFGGWEERGSYGSGSGPLEGRFPAVMNEHFSVSG